MADYGKFKVGNVIYPLTADTTNSLLQDSDPTLFYIIDFIRTVLQTYVGERWKSEIDKINSEKGGIPINDGYVVATTYPYDPKRFYLQNKPVFPILAIYEIDSETELKTLSKTITQLRHEIKAETKVPLSYMGEYYDLIMHLELVISNILSASVLFP